MSKSTELFDYLRTAEQQLKALEEGSEKQGFLSVIIGEIKNKELGCVISQRCSRIIEYILKQVKNVNLFYSLFEKFTEPGTFQLLAENQYSSHVLQTLFGILSRTFPYLLSEEKIQVLLWKLVEDLLTGENIIKEGCDHGKKSSKDIAKEEDIIKSKKSITDLASDTCGTHVVRALLTCLAGFVPEIDEKQWRDVKKNNVVLPTTRLVRVSELKKKLDEVIQFHGGEIGIVSGEGVRFVEKKNENNEEEQYDEEEEEAKTQNVDKLMIKTDTFITTTQEAPFLLTEKKLLTMVLKLVRKFSNSWCSEEKNISISNPFFGPVIALSVAILGDLCSTQNVTLIDIEKRNLNSVRPVLKTLVSNFSMKDFDSLLQCPVASRVLEVCIEYHHSSGILENFLGKYLFLGEEKQSQKQAENLKRVLKLSQFAPFVLQKCLKALHSKGKDILYLELFLKNLDFGAIFTEKSIPHQMLAVCILDACRRSDCHYKLAIQKIIGDGGTTIVSGKKLPDLVRILLLKGIPVANKEESKKESEIIVNASHTIVDDALPHCSFWKIKIDTEVTAVGISLVKSLLSFPPKFVSFLVSDNAIKYLCNVDVGPKIAIRRNDAEKEKETDGKDGKQKGDTDEKQKCNKEKTESKKSTKKITRSWFQVLAQDLRTTRLIEELFSSVEITAITTQTKAKMIQRMCNLTLAKDDESAKNSGKDSWNSSGIINKSWWNSWDSSWNDWNDNYGNSGSSSGLVEKKKKTPEQTWYSPPFLLELVLNPKTSWLVTRMWNSCTQEMKVREAMAETLSFYEKILRTYNMAIWRNCELHAYKTRGVEWTQNQTRASKRHKVFHDIFQDNVLVAKKRKVESEKSIVEKSTINQETTEIIAAKSSSEQSVSKDKKKSKKEKMEKNVTINEVSKLLGIEKYHTKDEITEEQITKDEITEEQIRKNEITEVPSISLDKVLSLIKGGPGKKGKRVVSKKLFEKKD